MRTRKLLVSMVAIGALTAGCGATGTSVSSGLSGSSRSSRSSGSSGSSSPGASITNDGMKMDMGSSTEPSDPAAMICGLEIRAAVRRTFLMHHPPRGSSSWSKSDRIFSCSWTIPHGTLKMSVQDSLDRTGHAYYDKLKSSLPGATDIKGLENFNFPAFSTRSGDVVFLKDGKTLHVDATGLPARALPTGFSREDVAYSVAAGVIACWSE